MSSPDDNPEPKGSPDAAEPKITESSNPDDVRRALQTQHPGLGDDIQSAIRTLRKLQTIAGAPTGAVESADESGMATADGTRSDDNGVPILGAGETFGRYQISRLLGRGGMGAVYLAYDSQLCRYVALKTPRLGSNPETVKRFYREARATATLRSPYVCPVYDVGQIGGIHYLSMAFIDGKPLRQMIAEGQLNDLARVATIVAKVARGLQKAHEKGIIHRDIKSENIMIDSDGEPIVMDFGLAKQVEDDVHLTTPGRLVGSPAYMSPEQIDGDPTQLGPTTDIYSLGVVLYEMLTGRLPFWGSLTSILRKIPSEAPVHPSTLVPAVGHDSLLERVCLKMLAKAPGDRYPSMAAVAETLAPTTAGAAEEKPPERKSWWRRIWTSSAPPAPVAPPAGPVAGSREKTIRDTGEPPPDSGSGGSSRGASDPDAMPTADFTPPPKS